MGIKEMLKREDFYKILRETIIDYAHKVLHQTAQCDYDPFDGCEVWSINALLGFVSRTPTPKGIRTYMKSEYNVRGSWVKNLIGKLAVDVITTIPSIGTTKKIYISKGVFAPSVFIVPQNRSIRFYDYEKMTVDCIVKAGFTSKYFDNQTEFRKTYLYDFLNPMLECGNGWFREPVLEGHPLIRTTEESLFRQGTQRALQYLKMIAADTLEWIPKSEYILSLKEDAVKKIGIAKEKKQIREAEAALTIVNEAASLAENYNGNIPTCMSHGDFQSGNIWIEPTGMTLIYDWETAGRRSVWYDSATLSYSLRRAFGWSSMLEDKTGEGVMKCIPDSVDLQNDIKVLFSIILLEDILFYLDDMLELPDVWGRSEFDCFIENIKSLNWL